MASYDRNVYKETLPIQHHKISGSFCIALQNLLQVLNLLLQITRITFAI